MPLLDMPLEQLKKYQGRTPRPDDYDGYWERALEPRIKKAAPVYPFLSDYKRVWEMDLAKDAYAELRTFFRHFDPQHKQEEEIFTRLGYIDIQNLAPRIRADVMVGVGLMDSICPPSSQFAAINKMEAPVQL